MRIGEEQLAKGAHRPVLIATEAEHLLVEAALSHDFFVPWASMNPALGRFYGALTSVKKERELKPRYVHHCSGGVLDTKTDWMVPTSTLVALMNEREKR